MSLLHDAYTALLSGLTYKENGKIKWVDEWGNDIWITIIDTDKEEYYCEYANGDKFWYQEGKLHRLDGPAVERTDGNKLWFQNGQLHRLGGPAVEYTSGNKCWYQKGKRHRIDGPAVEQANGNKVWYQEDKRHREDGPAVEYINGDKEWYINGKELTKEEFNKVKNVYTT